MLGGEEGMSASLPYTAAACVLAKALFTARQHAYELEGASWEALDPNEKAKYVTWATDALQALRPVTRSAYFDLAAHLARTGFPIVAKD